MPRAFRSSLTVAALVALGAAAFAGPSYPPPQGGGGGSGSLKGTATGDIEMDGFNVTGAGTLSGETLTASGTVMGATVAATDVTVSNAVTFAELGGPADTPSAGSLRLYAIDKVPYVRDSDGNVHRLYSADGTGTTVAAGTVSVADAYTVQACSGRLTVSSTDPVASSGTPTATLYFLPYNGARVPLYNGSRWVVHTLGSGGISTSAAALTHSQVYDIFVYDNAGTLTLDPVAWSNHGAGTGARATALATQDGVYVKTGATGRRYVGTIRTVDSSGTKAVDGPQQRYVWNAHNRIPVRDFSAEGADSWTVSSTNGTWGAVNSGDASWRHDFVVGLTSTVGGRAHYFSVVNTTSAACAVAIDSTSAIDRAKTTTALSAVSICAPSDAEFSAEVAIGYHFLQAVETSSASGGTQANVFGDNAAGINPLTAAGMFYLGER